jgi:hypothetical protein
MSDLILSTDDARWIRVSDIDHDLVALSISGDPPVCAQVSPSGSIYLLPIRKIIASRLAGRKLLPTERVFNSDGDRRNMTRENIYIKCSPTKT